MAKEIHPKGAIARLGTLSLLLRSHTSTPILLPRVKADKVFLENIWFTHQNIV